MTHAPYLKAVLLKERGASIWPGSRGRLSGGRPDTMGTKDVSARGTAQLSPAMGGLKGLCRRQIQQKPWKSTDTPCPLSPSSTTGDTPTETQRGRSLRCVWWQTVGSILISLNREWVTFGKSTQRNLTEGTGDKPEIIETHRPAEHSRLYREKSKLQ